MSLKPPKLTNDCFALPRGVAWIPVDEALNRLKKSLHRITEIEKIPTNVAEGRILAISPTATRSSPPMSNSAVDGFGFAHSCIESGPQNLPLTKGIAAAGLPYEGKVKLGSAIKILTGAILPSGVDTVILAEDTNSDDNTVAFNGPIRLGSNTRLKGEDIQKGNKLIDLGIPIRSTEIGLLNSVGIFSISVYKKLKVGILSTGNEIIYNSQSNPLPHQIFDANKPMLSTIVKKWGFEVIDLGHADDNEETLLKKMDSASKKVDVIITSGGASAGQEDYISKIMNNYGSISSWRVAIKPGRPIAMGIFKGTPVFGLPGNPVAAFVCSVIFVRPALYCLSGAGWVEPHTFWVPANFTKHKKPGRQELLRANLTQENSVNIFKSEGSGRISGLSWANGLVDLPSGLTKVDRGDLVKFIPYSSLGI